MEPFHSARNVTNQPLILRSPNCQTSRTTSTLTNHGKVYKKGGSLRYIRLTYRPSSGPAPDAARSSCAAAHTRHDADELGTEEEGGYAAHCSALARPRGADGADKPRGQEKRRRIRRVQYGRR